MIQPQFPEILAPAGGEEQLKAAVRCGAGAVYLGTQNFNARRNADNFSSFDLEKTVKYCHSYGVKVYVTLNTLIFDKELKELYETVKYIAKSGADAVIVQDFAVINAVKEICPDMALHASTQMAVHNLSGAKFLEKQGFSRVVLAREMSLDEIKDVTENTTLETEVFVHGAHCMSSSGNCYISAMFGERSGNRGKCAQVCRLDWKSNSRSHALSLKDMSYLDSIDELKNAGVTSFKIEGRMKRPEYVAAAVQSTKNALNGISYDKETLKSIFSRSGFTDGYLKGKIGADMFGYRGKDDVTAAAPVLKKLETLYKNDVPVRPVKMILTLKKGEKSVLEMTYNGISVSSQGEEGQTPVKEPLCFEIAERNLKKLGGTPFVFDSLKFENDDSLTLPASSINAMRRECAEKLIEEITKHNRRINEIKEPEINRYKAKTGTVRARFEKMSQYSSVFEKCESVSFPLDEILKNKNSVKNIKTTVYAELPELLYSADERLIFNKLEELKTIGINDVVSGNIGTLFIAKDKCFKIHGNYGLNITNSQSLSFFENEGLEDTIISFEMNEKSVNSLGAEIKRGIISYGYLPLMFFRACPQKGVNGCGDCTGISALTDRKNVEFALLCKNKKYSVLLNSVPLYVGDKQNFNVDFSLLYFTTENSEECKNILETFVKKGTVKGPKTSGIYYRELL